MSKIFGGVLPSYLAVAMTPRNRSALAQGLKRCPTCGLLSHVGTVRCTGCGGHCPARKVHSLQRTSALLLCGYVLYIPANLYPMMIVEQFGVSEQLTLMGGILALLDKGLVPIAVLVFVASVLVPLLKLLGLSLLVANARWGWQGQARFWTQVYRLILFVGRWSMLDIFMIGILVAIVDLGGGVSKVLAGPAALAFAAVVVLTMFAAKTFDPRLIWDKQLQL